MKLYGTAFAYLLLISNLAQSLRAGVSMFSRNKVGALAIALAALSGSSAYADIVTNGGFESGGLSGWTQTGDTSFAGVQCPGPGSAVAEGNCSAFFGSVGAIGGITQNLSTVAGQDYLISFALKSDGDTPNSFSAFFGATQLISLTDIVPAGPYNVMSFTAQATSGTTALSFNFRDDPGFLDIDAISVNAATAVPEPLTLTVFGAGLVGAVAARRRKAKNA